MRCEIGLIIEWEPCDSGDTEITSMEDVLEYVQATVDSNAHFEHLDLEVKSAGVKELED